MALLQIDFALQTIAYNFLLYAATMSPASRLLSLHVHGKLIYQMPCIHTSLHTCPHDLSRVTKTPSFDHNASVGAGRAMSRSWKRTVPLPARGPLQMPGEQKPNVVEAHAMELIKSMLYLADTTGHSQPRHPPCCDHQLLTMLSFPYNMLWRFAIVVAALGHP